MSPTHWRGSVKWPLEEKEAVIDLLQTQYKENLLGARTIHMSIILGKGFWKRVCSRDRQYKEVLHLKSFSPRVWLKRCLWDKEAGWSEAQDGP